MTIKMGIMLMETHDTGPDNLTDMADELLAAFDGRHRVIPDAQVDLAREDMFDGETLADALARREGVAVADVDGTWHAANSASPLWARLDTDTPMLAPAEGGSFLTAARASEVDIDLVSRMPVSAIVEVRRGKAIGPEPVYDVSWRRAEGNVAQALSAELRANPGLALRLFAYEPAPMWEALYR